MVSFASLLVRIRPAPLNSSVRRLGCSMKTTLLIILALLFLQTSSNGQSKTLEPIVVEGNVSSCESNAAAFDNLAGFLRSTEERLFVVARLGVGERRRDLNRRRLHNVRIYFKDGWPKIDPKRFVFLEGDPVEGEGRIEFYLGSHLIQISLVKRGKDICVDCCDYPDYRYYGAGKKDKSNPKRQ